jgi:RNA polymerase sigma factor (sigma-70 family)
MLAMDDMELLQEYALRNSEEAFATLVARHIDLVYSAALRQVGHHDQAEEITQAVFVILARKARSLGPGTILPGWLFRTTRLTAANYLRTEIRRARREQEAYMQSNPSANPEDLWQQVAPALNDAIADLREKDRNAIVLRFLKGKEYREVAAALGGTEAAAQMRVSRALEKLRKLFAKRGVALSTAALGSVITAHGIQAAPLGLAASVAATTLQGAALTASTLILVEGTLKIMAWTKVKFAVGAGMVALLAVQFQQSAVQARQLASARDNLRGTIKALAAQQSRIAELEQQTAAMTETRRSQELELERLRARRAAASRPGAPNPATASPTTLLSATLQDPDAREALRREMVENCRFRYGPFFGQNNLDPQEAEKLFQKGGDYAMRNLEAVAAFTEGRISADAAVQVEIEGKQDGANQVRLALGEAGLAKFEEYVKSRSVEVLMDQLEKHLTVVYALNPDQRSRLTEIIQAEPPEVTHGLAGELTVAALVYPDQLNLWFERQTEVNQDILQRGAGFLTPDQSEILELMQTSNLTTQKRNVLRFLRKL